MEKVCKMGLSSFETKILIADLLESVGKFSDKEVGLILQVGSPGDVAVALFRYIESETSGTPSSPRQGMLSADKFQTPGRIIENEICKCECIKKRDGARAWGAPFTFGCCPCHLLLPTKWSEIIRILRHP